MQLSVQKQLLMIIIDAAAATKFQSSYSNFEWEVNFHHSQNWYKQIIENWSQLFYSTQSYYVAEDFNFDNKNIYNVNSDQTQDNLNFNSN